MSKFLSKWYIYLVSIVLLVSAFCIGVSMKCAPKDNERINIFIGATDCKSGLLYDQLNYKKPDGTLVVNINFHYCTDDNFTYFFSSFRSEMDIFILPSEYVKNNEDIVTTYSANLDVEEFNQYLGFEAIYYQKDDFFKGIQVYNSSENSGVLTDYISYENENYSSDYYLFFNYESVNLGFVNDSQNDNAIEIVRTIFNESL